MKTMAQLAAEARAEAARLSGRPDYRATVDLLDAMADAIGAAVEGAEPSDVIHWLCPNGVDGEAGIMRLTQTLNDVAGRQRRYVCEKCHCEITVEFPPVEPVKCDVCKGARPAKGARPGEGWNEMCTACVKAAGIMPIRRPGNQAKRKR